VAAWIPDKLPTCLRRCGIIPRGFLLHTDDANCIQDYLGLISAKATTALAKSR